MVILKESVALKRKIRQDKPEDLAVLTQSLAYDAMGAGRVQEAFDLIEYGEMEKKQMYDLAISFTDDVLSLLMQHGEEKLEEFLRHRYYDRIKNWIQTTPGVEESLQRFTEYLRGHFSKIKVIEEQDRYVVICDPCGSAGALRRIRKVGTTKNAYFWTWGKSGVPYYCAHCCIAWEVLATEIRGYPLRITQIGERPEDPCIHFHYKKPELIPEEFFTRIGKIKTKK